MAELPHLGKHCSEESCKQLDFLPMKCDGCKGIFCKDHIQYRSHNCEVAHTKDIQVPVCPLCDQPIPVARGETPDIRVGAHIDNDCQSDPAIAKRKIYKNKCSLKGCKQKEMIKVLCPNCQLNYCLKHRHPADHKCKLTAAGSASSTQAGAAALARQNTSQHTAPARSRDHSAPKNTPNVASTFQNLSEDEALARALQMSLMDGVANSEPEKLPNSMEEEDAMLSRAIALSEQEYQQQQLQRRDSRNSKCIVA